MEWTRLNEEAAERERHRSPLLTTSPMCWRGVRGSVEGELRLLQRVRQSDAPPSAPCGSHLGVQSVVATDFFAVEGVLTALDPPPPLPPPLLRLAAA